MNKDVESDGLRVAVNTDMPEILTLLVGAGQVVFVVDIRKPEELRMFTDIAKGPFTCKREVDCTYVLHGFEKPSGQPACLRLVSRGIGKTSSIIEIRVGNGPWKNFEDCYQLKIPKKHG